MPSYYYICFYKKSKVASKQLIYILFTYENMKISIFCSLFVTVFLCQFSSLAQQTPAKAQTEAILIAGATAHLGNGEVVENSLIAFREGKITFVGKSPSGQDFSTYRTVEARGKHVYPGFIAPNSTLGLREIDAVRATNDYVETGVFNPNVRAIIAYNTDSRVTPTVRSNGVLLAQIVPQGGRISGTSAVVELDGWNWEDAAYRAEAGIHLHFPTASSFAYNEDEGSPSAAKNEDYKRQMNELEDFFEQAIAYQKKETGTQKNLKLEAMRGIFDGSKRLFIHSQSAKNMTQAVLFAKKYKVVPVIVGGGEAYLMTDFLKENKIAVVLGRTQSLPMREDDDIDQPYKNPKLLFEAGVLFAFSNVETWQQRNLAFQAGQAVGFGLPKEAAVRALTLNTATILGIEKTVGSLEVGKDATLFVSEGDALDMRSSLVEQAFIRGKNIDLGNKQKALYEKYKNNK